MGKYWLILKSACDTLQKYALRFISVPVPVREHGQPCNLYKGSNIFGTPEKLSCIHMRLNDYVRISCIRKIKISQCMLASYYDRSVSHYRPFMKEIYHLAVDSRYKGSIFLHVRQWICRKSDSITDDDRKTHATNVDTFWRQSVKLSSQYLFALRHNMAFNWHSNQQ